MLKRAKNYEKEINQFREDLDNKDYLKFYATRSFFDGKFEVLDSEWSDITRVSIDKSGKLLGYMFCGIDRNTNHIDNIGLANISKLSNITLAKDFLEFFESLLIYKKISWTVIVGNPAEKIYDRLIKKYDGRIVGIQKEHIKLSDEKYYDLKLYEIVKGSR